MFVLRVSTEGLKWNRKSEVLRGLMVRIACHAFEQSPNLQKKQNIGFGFFFFLFKKTNPLEVCQTLILKNLFWVPYLQI